MLGFLGLGNKKPSYPDISVYSGFPMDQDDWTCSHWKQYYQNIKALAGRDAAVNAVSVDLDNISLFSSAHTCKFNCDWMDFMRGQGVDVASLLSSVYCIVYRPVRGAEKVTKHAVGFASFITHPVVILGLVGVVGGIVYYSPIGKDIGLRK